MTVKKRLAAAACLLLFSCTLAQEAYAGTWKQGIGGDQSAWWYDNGDGTYPVSTWAWLDGNQDGKAECYYFDDKGRMLSDTVTPDGYTVDENGAWRMGFVRQKYVLNAYQTEVFKDAAEGLLNVYEDQLYGPSFSYLQLRYIMLEARQDLMNALLTTATEKHLADPNAVTLFVPVRLVAGVGYFDNEKTLTAYQSAFNIGLGTQDIPHSDQGELKGTPLKEGNRYRITSCQQDSDGTFLYLTMTYEKTDAATQKVLRTGTFFMKLYRNQSKDIGYFIDEISNQETYG